MHTHYIDVLYRGWQTMRGFLLIEPTFFSPTKQGWPLNEGNGHMWTMDACLWFCTQVRVSDSAQRFDLQVASGPCLRERTSMPRRRGEWCGVSEWWCAFFAVSRLERKTLTWEVWTKGWVHGLDCGCPAVCGCPCCISFQLQHAALLMSDCC